MPPKRQGRYLVKRAAKRQRRTTKNIISRYVNKTLLTRPLSSERKWFQYGTQTVTFMGGETYAINPFYWLAQGTQQDQRVGLTVQDVNLYIDIVYAHNGATNLWASQQCQSSMGRCIVFSNPTQWHQSVTTTAELNTAGLGTVIPTSQVFLDNTNNRRAHSYLNKDYNKILYDTGPIESHIYMPNTSAVTPTYSSGVNVNRKIKLKIGDLRYQANGNQSYLRDDNVYIWFTGSMVGFNTTNNNDQVGTYTMNILVTWNDS